MPLEIFPQNVTLFPNDRQLFTARAKDLTASMWKMENNRNGILLPDFSVRSAEPAANPLVSAQSAHRLVRGVGSVEWTITKNSQPISGGTLTFNFQLRNPPSSSWQFNVHVQFDRVKVFIEGSEEVANIPLPVAVGMRFRVDISNGFHLFVDDILRHSRTSFGFPIAYPASFTSGISGSVPFVVTPPATIPAPRLSGDWQLRPLSGLSTPIVAFTTPAHGSLSAGASELQKAYSNGTIPGVYKLRADINPGADIWFDSGPPAGATVSTSGGVWTWANFSPTPPFQPSLQAPLAAGRHFYSFLDATTTLQVNVGDTMVTWVYLDPTNTPQEIMVQWRATDSTIFEHRAFWGADLIIFGTLGTPSRRFMGALPTTGQWVRLEVPASLVDLEGRVLNGISLEFYDGQGSFDQISRVPNLQRAEAIITIPPLEILGDLVRTLQPGQKVRFQTNYDVAQTSLITWSVVSGSGSFSQGEFTAGTAPGMTVVRATASVGNQVADITINVPAVITPSFGFAAPLEVIDWDTNIPSPTWSSVPTGINSGTGLWTAPSLTGQTAKITVTDGVFTVTRDVLILEKFPLDPSAAIKWERRKTVLISTAEDRSRTARVKDKDGLAFEAWELTFKNKDVAELATAVAFFDAHHPGKRFIFDDKLRGIRKVVYFDSNISVEADSTCAIDFSFRIVEA